MIKRAVALKNTLVILMIFSASSLTFLGQVQETLRLYKNIEMLEKQKVIEFILYSYFMSHLNQEINEVIENEQYYLAYKMYSSGKLSTLEVTIQVDIPYQWIVIYDHDQKQIQSSMYKSLSNREK